MTLRCGCPDDAKVRLDGGFRDETVFGPCWKCKPDPEPRPYEHVLSDDSEPGDLG